MTGVRSWQRIVAACSAVGGVASRVATVVVSAPIVLYRTLVSPLLGPRCRYHPTCSRYALDALREYGVLRGVVLAGWRLVRCNPWSPGGIDPVDNQRLFRRRRAPGSRRASGTL